MALYQRGAGGHIAERVQPEPGSDEEARLAALADDPKSDWYRAEKPDPKESAEAKRPAKNASQEAWAAYAVAKGANEDEAKAASRDDLIAAYGG